MKPNEVLSPEKYKVELLKENETAKFVLCDLATESNRTNVETGQKIPSIPLARMISGERFVYDSVKQKNIRIGNVTAEEWNEQKERYDPVVTPVIFEKGFLILDHTQNDTYQYLMRINENKSNPFRKEGSKAIFEKEDQAKTLRDSIAVLDMQDEVKDWIKSAEYKDILACLKALPESLKSSINPESPIDEIRYSLRMLNNNNHTIDIIKASNNDEAKLKVQINEAENFGIIKRDTVRKVWSWHDGVKICETDMKDGMVEGLVKFYAKDNKLYLQLVEALRKLK